MLPALLLPSKPNERHSFTRRPEWVRPLESLWSILAKWQFVNRLPYSTIASAILGRGNVDQGVDLRLLDHFRLDAFAEHSGLSRSMLSSAACCSSADSRLIEIASQHLRFCVACMEEGFHATLFQFMPIRRCPIHHCLLRETCTSCRKKIPYRLDASFAALPYACPHCAHPLLPNPTTLARQHRNTTAHDTLLSWQQFLATYVYWYADGNKIRRGESGRILSLGSTPACASIANSFDFMSMLQTHLDVPPPLPIFAIDTEFPSGMPPQTKSSGIAFVPDFSRQSWPRFHTRRFLTLCRRYSRFCDRLQQLKAPRQREVTIWWRRSWEGAISRQCDLATPLAYPPFGIAEWVGYSVLPAPLLKRQLIQQRIGLHFEQDLRATWHAWDCVITHLQQESCNALHPYLVPPRACWLNTPSFDPGTPALGFL